MTYTESYMKKYATEPSQYKQLVDKRKAGDSDIEKGMNTVSGQELLWTLLGAGLGGGGGYLLSKRFRRDGSKRQRALDVLLGALIGAGGTQLALSLPGDEDSGLSLRETMRADKLIGDKARDNSKAEKYPNPLRLNAITGTGIGLGATAGALKGRHLGFYLPAKVNGKTEWRWRKMENRLGKIYADRISAPGQPTVDAATRDAYQMRGRNAGRNVDTMAGALEGALAGYGVSVGANALVDAFTRDSYQGDMK